MLLKLLPSPPDPTILFTIQFQDLPDNVPTPSSWSSQLALLAADHLELPNFVHSLDTSCMLATLIDTVVFDLSSLLITCYFVDGLEETWNIIEPGCLHALNSVVVDVRHASIQVEKDPAVEFQREFRSSPLPVAKLKHKRHKSLFGSLVSTLAFFPPPSIFIKRASLPTVAIPPKPPRLLPTPSQGPADRFSSPATPTMLRKRARSTLVDSFRRYVLSELRARNRWHNYFAWIIQSMLRRSAIQMQNLVHIPPHVDDPDSQSAFDTRFISFASNAAHQRIQCVQLFHSPPSSHADGTVQHQKSSASQQRLKNLLLAVDARHWHDRRDQQQRIDALEIRCRRKAWLNKSLTYLARRDYCTIGYTTPFRSSLLSRYSYTSEEYDVTPDDSEEATTGTVAKDTVDSIPDFAKSSLRSRFFLDEHLDNRQPSLTKDLPFPRQTPSSIVEEGGTASVWTVTSLYDSTKDGAVILPCSKAVHCLPLKSEFVTSSMSSRCVEEDICLETPEHIATSVLTQLSESLKSAVLVDYHKS